MRRHQRAVQCRSYRFGLGYRFSTVLVAIGLGTVLLLVAESSRQKPLSVEEKTFLERYEIVRSKLAHDDLAGARGESSPLVQFPGLRVATTAQAIADSNTLEQARTGFTGLSKQAVSIARNKKGYYVMHCPPVGCPQNCGTCPMSRFSDWVQITPVVENPFLGGNQTGCGVVRD